MNMMKETIKSTMKIATEFGLKRNMTKKGNLIYYENSFGYILDKRVKELTVEEIEKLLGYKIKIKGEKKWLGT